MRTFLNSLSVFLFFLCACSAQNGNWPNSENNVNEISHNSNHDDTYQLVGKIVWEETKVCSVEATLLNSRIALIDLPKNTPKHIFQIREIHTGKILFKEEDGESAQSLELVKLDSGEKLLFATFATGSAEVARGYLVKCDSSKEVFNEAYRDFFWHMAFYDDDNSHFIIFKADNSTEFDNKLMIQQWEWNGSEFQINGVVPYNDFIKNLNRIFQNKKKLIKLPKN